MDNTKDLDLLDTEVRKLEAYVMKLQSSSFHSLKNKEIDKVFNKIVDGLVEIQDMISDIQEKN